MDEKKTPQPEQAAPETGKPLSEKRKSALLRYMAVLFCAAFILVLISLILQTHSSKAKISELNAASTSALSNGLVYERQLCILKLFPDIFAEEESQAAENEMIKSLRTELDRTKEAYEALLEAKACETREGNVTFSRAMQTLERLKDYLGQTALEEYKALGGE